MDQEKLYIWIILHNLINKNMKNRIKYILGLSLATTLFFVACQKDDYSLGELKSPSNIMITTEVVGKDVSNPNGDGSGDVKISVSADNVTAFKYGWKDITDVSTETLLDPLPFNGLTKKFTDLGTHTYRITVVAYGAGGTSSTSSTEVTVVSNFTPDASTVSSLTNGTSKTWVVNKDIPGHFGVGPWSSTSVAPEWWAAGINEKVACCNCFYTTTFNFTKVSTTSYTLQVSNPDGAFTKTGSLASIPNIPASGNEGCYPYSGGTSAFNFVPPSTGITFPSMTTQTAIKLEGNNTYIGYGALKREFQIISITANELYLRVQGTEEGNAWYLKLKPAP